MRRYLPNEHRTNLAFYKFSFLQTLQDHKMSDMTDTDIMFFHRYQHLSPDHTYMQRFNLRLVVFPETSLDKKKVFLRKCIGHIPFSE